MSDRPKIITLCGSTRFIELFAVIGWWLERDEGAIVLSLHLLPGWYMQALDHGAEAEGVADHFDALHLQKISMSDEVYIINLEGYVGESTTREIHHAEEHRKPLRWLDPTKVPEHFQHIPTVEGTDHLARLLEFGGKMEASVCDRVGCDWEESPTEEVPLRRVCTRCDTEMPF